MPVPLPTSQFIFHPARQSLPPPPPPLRKQMGSLRMPQVLGGLRVSPIPSLCSAGTLPAISESHLQPCQAAAADSPGVEQHCNQLEAQKEKINKIILSMEKSEARRWDFLFWVMGASCLQLKLGGFILELGPVRSQHLLGCQSQSLSRAASPSTSHYVSFMSCLSGHPVLGGFFCFTSCFVSPDEKETQWPKLIPFHESCF